LFQATELDSLGNPTNSFTTMSFFMNIIDINDNYPLFQNTSYRMSIPEVTQDNLGFAIPGLDIICSDRDEVSWYSISHFLAARSGTERQKWGSIVKNTFPI
jgi:hypothetical protein